jgi:UDP-GlcNAc:undecaprenyl-phosphate/decaprenyl-phosphate GlcNAc-1-phosphate transferase
VYATTPLAIRVADRFEFYDRPVGYKAHGTPTPYLGGAAVMAGFVLALVVLAGDSQRTLPVLGGTVLMWAVGTLDDRRTVRPRVRVAVEVALAALIWQLGLGWQLGFGPLVDLMVTAAWVVAVVNAFNLFDNMDGATPSMGVVAAAGLVVLGAAQGNAWLAVAAAALCGACAGFLPHNLSSPARIFLGDGGSMPIGFAVASLTMIGVSEAAAEWQSLAMGLLFVGVPALDTTLVMISRRRRGISVLTGGRDHITHRTKNRLRTARAVAVALGSAQAVISALAVVALEGGSSATVAAVSLYLTGAGVTIAVVDTRWAPVEEPTVSSMGQPSPATRRLRQHRTRVALLATLPLAAALGASPFLQGYYSSKYWVPAGLVAVVALTAGVIAAPPRLSRPALLVICGLAGLVAWSLASALWADSIEQAVTEANRLLVYAAFAGVLLVVLRTDAATTWLMGAIGAVVVAGAVITAVRMLGSSPGDLFLAGRLDAPLGYINGQAAIHLLGLWCCLAATEQRRSAIAAGLGLAGATLLAALLILSQSRGVAIATAVSAVAVLALVPGRLRRVGALATLGIALAAASGPLLAVYDQGRAGAVTAATAHAAAHAALLAGLASGVVWAAVTAFQRRSPGTVQRLRPVAATLVACAMLVLAALVVADRHSIDRTLDNQYAAFVRLKPAQEDAQQSTTRLASGAGNRYDYWRIAWRTWEERPLLGVGAGNYDRPYFLHRATAEDVRQPHSVALQVLSELGLIGMIFLATIVVGIGWGAWRLAGAVRHAPDLRPVAVASIGVTSAWLAHTSVDWLHLLPGVTGIALAAVAILVRERTPLRAPSPVRAVPRRRRLAWAAVLAVCLALAGVSLSRQELSEYFVSRAQHALPEHPAEAVRQADRALRLDPEAVRAYYTKAAGLARFDQAAAARGALLEGARREPRNYVTWALLGDLAVRTGDLTVARQDYGRALALNPRDAGLRRQASDPSPR